MYFNPPLPVLQAIFLWINMETILKKYQPLSLVKLAIEIVLLDVVLKLKPVTS